MTNYQFTPKQNFAVELTSEYTRVNYVLHVHQGYRYVFYGILASALFLWTARSSEESSIIFLPILLFGALPILRGLALICAKRRVIFGPDCVYVRERSWVGSHKWSAPYADFHGVRSRTRLESRHYGFYITELLHPIYDPIPLRVDTGYHFLFPDRPACENAKHYYAEKFRLPVLGHDGWDHDGWDQEPKRIPA